MFNTRDLKINSKVKTRNGSEERLGIVTRFTGTRVFVKMDGLVGEREFHLYSGKRYSAGQEVGTAGQFRFSTNRIVGFSNPAFEAQINREKTRQRASERQEAEKEQAQESLLTELKDSVAGIPNANASFTSTISYNRERITGYTVDFEFKTRAEFDAFVKRFKATY
jgi:hypothetical protein